MDYQTFFDHSLTALRTEGRYRVFAEIVDERTFPAVTLRRGDYEGRATVWCSNNYLGLGHDPRVKRSMQDALDRFGTGAGGTRNIAGTKGLHAELEHALAQWHGREAALVFTSGYVANVAALGALGRQLPDCMFLSDEKNHNSLIEGMRAARCDKQIFRHNDMNDLEAMLKALPMERAKVIVTESVFSMDGDCAPLQTIVDLARRYNALTYLDEVHAVGMYGPTGAGKAEQAGLLQDFTIIQGTMGKALGVIGGYLAGDRRVVDFIRSHAAPFIFTTALPPMIAAGALTSIGIICSSPTLRRGYAAQTAALQQALIRGGVMRQPTDSHIALVHIGDAHDCNAVAETLLREHGLYAQPINYPTVPRGEERLRITITPKHTDVMVATLIEGLQAVLGKKLSAAA